MLDQEVTGGCRHGHKSDDYGTAFQVPAVGVNKHLGWTSQIETPDTHNLFIHQFLTVLQVDSDSNVTRQ